MKVLLEEEKTRRMEADGLLLGTAKELDALRQELEDVRKERQEYERLSRHREEERTRRFKNRVRSVYGPYTDPY